MKSTDVLQVNRKKLEEDLRLWVTICFMALTERGVTFETIALRTGLSRRTVTRLWKGEFTLNVRFGTIQALATAAEISLSPRENSVSGKLLPYRHLQALRKGK